MIEKIIMDLSADTLELGAAMRVNPKEVKKNMATILAAYKDLGGVINGNI